MEYQSRLLLPSYTVAFSTELACVLGSDRQAQILQQVSYWIDLARGSEGAIGKFEDGRWWVYQEMRVWRKRFAFLSKVSLKRHRKALEMKGVLLRKDEVDLKAPGGVRVWYTIDYDRLEELRQAYLASPDEDDEGDEDQSDEGEENGTEGGVKSETPLEESGIKMISPARRGDIKLIPPRYQSDITFTIRSNKTSSKIHNGSAAPPADAGGAGSPRDAALLEQKQTPNGQQSYVKPAQSKRPRVRTNEQAKRADDENGKRRVNPAELTELGKLIVHLSGKGSRNKVPTASLTEKQAQRLDTEVEFFHGDEKIVITPNELYDREPEMLRRWLEKVVHPKLYDRYARRRGYVLGRDKLINALTLEGGDGYDIRSYYEWRESQKHLERLDAESYIVQPDEDVSQHVSDSKQTTVMVAALSPEELARFWDDEDETERSADDDEQE